MAYTHHGHHIPDTLKGTEPKEVANCGGTDLCAECKKYELMYWKKQTQKVITGGETDAEVAEKLAHQYITENIHPTKAFSVEALWFSRILQNWKAILVTDLVDDLTIEVTHDGYARRTYVNVYKKSGHATYTKK